jgi:hypothetical protein
VDIIKGMNGMPNRIFILLIFAGFEKEVEKS